MAVGFSQEEERTYIIKVKGSVSDYIWNDHRIREAKERLNRAFDEFEEALEYTRPRGIESVEIVSVQRGPSETI